MGMYDYVVCEHPLDDGTTLNGVELQTKDFECSMDIVRITPEGRLILRETHGETVPEQERPYYGKPEWDGPYKELYRLSGSYRTIAHREYDAQYHGDMRFCSMDSYYVARFTHGQLEYIRKVEDDYN